MKTSERKVRQTVRGI